MCGIILKLSIRQNHHYLRCTYFKIYELKITILKENRFNAAQTNNSTKFLDIMIFMN